MSFEELTFDERLGLLVDREVSKHNSSKINQLIHQGRFQNSEACVKNIHYHSKRRLDRKLILELASCQYIHHARSVNIQLPDFLEEQNGQTARVALFIRALGLIHSRDWPL